MLNKTPRSVFFRRLKFYIFGVLLGLILVNIMFKGRSGCKMPGTVKLEELRKQNLEYTEHASCRMKCRGIAEGDVKHALEKGKINYSQSHVHDTPCPTYAVEVNTERGEEIRIIVADCDTVSRIVTAIDLGPGRDSCACK